MVNVLSFHFQINLSLELEIMDDNYNLFDPIENVTLSLTLVRDLCIELHTCKVCAHACSSLNFYHGFESQPKYSHNTNVGIRFLFF